MMKIVRLRLMLGLALALGATFGLATVPAVAQDGQAAETPPPAKWVKRCLKREGSDAVFCEISFGRFVTAGSEGNQRWLATAGIQEVQGNPEKDLFIFAPLGVRLLSGLAYRIDEGEAKRAPYTICMARGCQVVIKIKDDMIASLKAGSHLQLQFQDAAGKTVGGRVTLSGFTAAYDGEPLEIRTVAAPPPQQDAEPAAGGDGGKGDAPVN